MSKDLLRDKIAGAVYGFAIGDAMGATTEFMSYQEIMRKYTQVRDIIGGGWLDLKAGEVTDDTQMTMCVMEALMDTCKGGSFVLDIFLAKCRINFIKWYSSKPKDIGGRCARSIEWSLNSGRLFPEEDTQALGNGSLMRALPCALLINLDNNEDVNVKQGMLTHNNKTCTFSIEMYTQIIRKLLITNGLVMIPDTPSLMEPTGHVVNTLNNAVYFSGKSKTFEEAIIKAVNHGGDADTIAAITGSIAGIRFGYNQIPTRWIDQLNNDVKIYLEKFINFVFSYLQN